MKRFNVGQEVVCVKKDEWRGHVTGRIARWPMPKYNEVVTINECFDYEGVESCTLQEYSLPGRNCFNVKWFEPLITTSQLEKELESITKTIEV